jgi:hypothetical protein
MADETASTAINYGDPVTVSAETYNQPSGSYTHHDFEHHTDGEGTFSEGEGHGPPSPGGPRKMGNTKEVAASGEPSFFRCLLFAPFAVSQADTVRSSSPRFPP